MKITIEVDEPRNGHPFDIEGPTTVQIVAEDDGGKIGRFFEDGDFESAMARAAFLVAMLLTEFARDYHLPDSIEI